VEGQTRGDIAAAEAQVLQGEIQEFVRRHEARRHQFPRAVLVGLLAGLTAVAFRWLLFAGEDAREELLHWAHRHPAWGWIVLPVLGGIAAGLAGYLTRRYAPEAAGSGIPHIKGVLLHLRGMLWQRILPVKFFGGALAISAGLSLGREGPTVQMGAAVGQAVGRALRVSPRSRQTLIAAGAGAGLAAAFNAPLAGLVFVLEELQRDFSPHIFGTAFVAAVTADVVTRTASGQVPSFHVTGYPVPPLPALPIFALLGVVTGLAGVVYNRCLLGSLNLFARLSRRPPWFPAATVGVLAGLIGWIVPDALGGGHGVAEKVLSGHVALAAIPLLFLAKFSLSMFSYGCGVPGGIFAPLLVLGALLGLALGDVAHQFLPGLITDPAVFAVVGMAGYFTAIVRAPLTGIVLIVEMTNNYQQMLALLVTCLIAYAVADALGDRPVYEALLKRDLARGRESPHLDEPLMLEVPVSDGSAFDGKQVQELRLPPGCILVTVRRGTREYVPSGSTRLRGGDRLVAVVAPGAEAAIPLLRSAAEAGPSGDGL
jgi:CIC family chloride channel protein